MAPDPGGHAPRPGCRRRPGAQRPRHRRRARSTVSCSLAEDATNPGAARATTPAPRPTTRTSPCSTRCLTLTLTLTRSAGREPGNQNWCREHAPGPRVGPGSGEAGGTQMLGGRRPIPPSPADPKMKRSRPVRERVESHPYGGRGPTMMTRTFRVRGTGFSNPRFAKPDENCLVGVPVPHHCAPSTLSRLFTYNGILTSGTRAFFSTLP